MLRLYWPKETPPSILDGSWKAPPAALGKMRSIERSGGDNVGFNVHMKGPILAATFRF
jgi:hypothetical protein